MNAEQLRTASRMWRSGEKGTVIAKTIGVKVSRLFDVASRYRTMFPRRGPPVADRARQVAPIDMQGFDDGLPEGRMRWITQEGAIVTLPRISFIECPRASIHLDPSKAQAEAAFKEVRA